MADSEQAFWKWPRTDTAACACPVCGAGEGTGEGNLNTLKPQRWSQELTGGVYESALVL